MDALSLTDAETAQFTHEPLNLENRSIRLVRVHPLDTDGIIRCSMKHTDPAKWVANHPPGFRWPSGEEPYTCLSYVWGSDNPTYEILINEKRMQVRDNLFDFLCNVARKATPSAPYNGREGSDPKDPSLWTQDDEYPVLYTEEDEFHRWWWIDALCIDQTNVPEKNHQVQRMGNIYYDSESVVAWIGNGTEVAHLFQRANNDSYLITPETIDSGIEHLKASTYWTRAWIVQETRVSPTVYLLAQDVLVDAKSLRYLAAEPSLSPRTSELVVLLEGIAEDGVPTATLRSGFEARHDINLIERMWQFRHQQCFNRKDIVYSVLSIANSRSRVTVNYNRTFAELAKAVLKANDHDDARKDGVGACLCQAYMVIQSLQLNQDQENPEHEISWIEMQGLHGVPGGNRSEEQLLQCRQCLEMLDLASIGEATQRDRASAFVFCLSCKHEGYVRHDDKYNDEADDEAHDGSNDENNDENNDESNAEADDEVIDEADDDSKDELNDEANVELDDEPGDQADDEPNEEPDSETSSSTSTTPQDVTHHTQLGHLILFSGSTASPEAHALHWLSPPGSQDKQRSAKIYGHHKSHNETDDSLFLQLSVSQVCEVLDLVDSQNFEFTAKKIERIVNDEFKRGLVADWKVVD
jgi:hypothetical protein